MLGLICIGLLGLAAAGFVIFNNRAQEAAAVTATFTPIIPTPTLTGTPTATPTETPLPTPTGTLVVSGEEAGQAVPTEQSLFPQATPKPDVTATSTRVVPLPTATGGAAAAASPPSEAMPGSGGILEVNNGFLVWAGAGLLILLIAGGFGYKCAAK
jgi:hypothetical protein